MFSLVFKQETVVSTQNVDVDFDSLEMQNVLEKSEILFGYDDLRDNYDYVISF